MNPYIFDLKEVNATNLTIVGGKGSNLGELSRIDEVNVPEGFCISTEAYKKIIGENCTLHPLLNRLSLQSGDDRAKISELGAKIRRIIEGISIPEDMSEEITALLEPFGDRTAWAIRSSATAEDLPNASFAGQQDSYLNVIGKESILQHISKCWASLFSERAIYYRIQNGYDHRQGYLAVVVQRMIFPDAAGILFTADPLTSDRKIVSIDASFGLGEALAAGLVNADNYKVRNGRLLEKRIAAKKLAIHALEDGGTSEEDIQPEMQDRPALTDEQILQLEYIARKIEEHFGRPQDIEWALSASTIYILQTRPITTLYPIPEANDSDNHVYISVGHQQMMTDAMKPLGLSIFQLSAGRPMFKAGGRLFVDVANELASPASREMLLNIVGKSDPLIGEALQALLNRDDFIKPSTDDRTDRVAAASQGRPLANFQTLQDYDPSVVSHLIKQNEASVAELEKRIETKAGSDLIDFISEDILTLKKNLADPQSFGVIMTAMNASAWINEKMEEWLGEKNAADALTQSVTNNVTSEMGLALLDVADLIRPYPEVIQYLQDAKDEGFFDELVELEGGQEAMDAIRAYLEKYGMRCPGEIDITRSRWSEKPSDLIPIILHHVRTFAPHERERKFQQGRKEALDKELELLNRLKQLAGGEEKAKETKRMIDLLRNLIGYREYPKYGMIRRFFVYKQALLKEAEQLVQEGLIKEIEDIYYLTLEELDEVLNSREVAYETIKGRKDDYRIYEKLVPPRVITSDGEIVSGKYIRTNLPAGAIAGLPVSSGIIEGRARVLLTIDNSELETGDILVTTYTDPSWTPLFLHIKGLVTEVGGLMTHGAVIAREYGLPAVVGVEHATRLIHDGQRIRVNGTEGYVEFLPSNK